MTDSGFNTVTSPADDFVVSSTDSLESMQQVLGVEEPTETVEPVAEPEVVAESSERDADGRFKAKEKTEKARNNPVERMKAATAKEAEAKRERDAAQKERDDARAEGARYKAELEALRSPKPPVPESRPVAKADDEPNPADTAKYPNGEFDRQFIKDQARWEAKQEFQAQETKRQADAHEQRQAALKARADQEWQARLQATKKAIPDFDQRFKPDTPVHEQMIPFLRTDPEGPRLLLYLSEHPDDAQRIAALHPIAQIREFGKIAATFDAAFRGSASPVIPSKAPTPITPLGGGASANTSGESDDESFDAMYARRSREAKASR